ncbi:MAG TPA: response regulator, partial [Candidatus Limnocylindria bacterium]|nr:response regulator [Candidatus Limnocylindria bacterium]
MKYVLLAEDDPELADMLSEVIRDQLYVATQVVANGALVPDAIAARRPDLLILDVALPGLSGVDVFELVRADERWQGVPVLFLTASPERAPADVASARVIAKPFDIAELVARV